MRALVILAMLLAFLVICVWFLSGHLRGPLVRYAAAQSNRDIRVDGRFEAYLFSRHPRLVAEDVTIGNPPWTQPGVTAQIGRLTLTYNLPWFGQSFGIRRLEASQAKLTLLRDPGRHANWQFREPGTGRGTGPPLLRSLSLPNAQVRFDDQVRHLKFDGVISAQDASGQGPNPPLRVDGAGVLNGRQANFTLNGAPLATVTRDEPYKFEFSESSSGSRLTGKGSVPRPFDFHELTATFEAAGEDLKDLYFLAGVSLPDTGEYHLSGRFGRKDRHIEFTDLEVTSGHSDMRASLSIEVRKDAPSHIEADLQSKLLRVADLGQKAAGRAPKSADGLRRVLPDTEIHLAGLRNSDAVVNFRAQTFEAGHVLLQSVSAKVRISDSQVSVAPISAAFRDGKLSGEFKFDVSRDVPLADVDLRVTNVTLPTLNGPLQARLNLKGHGSSIHGLASHANGTVTAILPRGAVRSAIPELAGFDLRGLGLLATGNKDDTGIRCGVASFEAQDGILTAQRLLVDTDPVLVTGEGTIDLESETLDLKMRGQPKQPRLRVRAPVLVRGTFGHPAFSTAAGKSAAQAGAAIALGVLLTPVAAMLAFVDPGLAQDADCAALLAQAREEQR